MSTEKFIKPLSAKKEEEKIPSVEEKIPSIEEKEKIPSEDPLQHLEKVEKKVLEFAGQKEMNPYIYIKLVLNPLKKRLASKEDKLAIKEALSINLSEIKPDIRTIPGVTYGEDISTVISDTGKNLKIRRN
jgi:type II secretory pathway component PulM